MAFTEFLQRQIPEARELANRSGMTKRAVGPSEFPLKGVGAKRINDPGGVFGAHSLTMPNSLAYVKTSEAGLPQILWQATTGGMTLEDRPFGDIAARIIWHRQLEGLEQKDYAKKAGLNRSQLSNWETGDYRLSLDGARALRKTYGLSLDFLFEGIDDALPMTLRAAWRDRS